MTISQFRLQKNSSVNNLIVQITDKASRPSILAVPQFAIAYHKVDELADQPESCPVIN